MRNRNKNKSLNPSLNQHEKGVGNKSHTHKKIKKNTWKRETRIKTWAIVISNLFGYHLNDFFS